MAILETRSVTYSYNDGSQERTILRDVNVDFDAGKFYTITGASGSGKTTLLALLSALDIPTSGTILFDGRSLAEIGEEAYRRQHIGIVFQNFNLISYMSAVDNVRIALGIIGEQDKQETTQKALTLSIAKEIAEQLGFTLTADILGDEIFFDLVVPITNDETDSQYF